MSLRKILFLYAFSALVLFVAACSTPKNNTYNPWNIADSDTLYLVDPDDGMQLFPPITGAMYKAINPRFIANPHGFTIKEYAYPDEEKFLRKSFELIAFDYSIIPDYNLRNFHTSLNATRRRNYYINDVFMHWYSRVLPSTLMLQAIEKIEYDPSDSILVMAMFPPGTPVSEYRSIGAQRFYTRDISKSRIDDRTTLYLLNDQVITRKIFEAVNPIYIKSLKRITNQTELAEYGRKDLKEIVKLTLFKKTEIIEGLVQLFECPECDIYLVDNIPLDVYTYYLLNRYYFKEVRVILEDEEEAFAPYKELFPEKDLRLRWKQQITVISL